MYAHKSVIEIACRLPRKSRSTGPYLINDQMQLLVAILCADKYFWKSEFGLWIFEVSGSCQKPGGQEACHQVNIPLMM